MAYRSEDEATNFNRNLANLQDRAEHGDNERLDQSPLAIADEIRAIYADKKLDADLDTVYDKHHENSVKSGVPSDVALKNMGHFYDGLVNPATTARTVAEARTMALGHVRPKPEEVLPEPENEHIADMIKRVAIPEAWELGEKREAKQRAAPTIQALKAAHGQNAPVVLAGLGEAWNRLLDDPVGFGPKMVNLAVQEQHRLAYDAMTRDEIDDFAKQHPEVKNPAIKARMVQELMTMPVNTDNALARALAAAKGKRNAVHTDAHRADVDADVRNNPALREIVRINKAQGHEGW